MDMRLEVVVLPVADADRSKDFYGDGLGWREDADVTGADGLRVVQYTPPGSAASVIFGDRVTEAPPGSARGLHLVVPDIEGARAELLARGVTVSGAFHDAGGLFHHAGAQARMVGADPQRRSYSSFAAFDDPDGNEWLLQEISVRLPGR